MPGESIGMTVTPIALNNQVVPLTATDVDGESELERAKPAGPSRGAVKRPSNTVQQRKASTDEHDKHDLFSSHIEDTWMDEEKLQRMKIASQRASRIVLNRTDTEGRLKHRHNQKHAVCDIVLYIFFIGVYFNAVMLQFEISNSYKLEGTMNNYLTTLGGTNSLENAKTLGGVWNFVEHGLISGLFPAQQWYNGQPFKAHEQGYLQNYNILVAGFSMYQRRIATNSDCAQSKKFPTWRASQYCWPKLTDETATTKPFGTAANPEFYVADRKGTYRQAFPLDGDLALAMLEELQDNLWLDKNSREISTEFTIYNSAMQLFCVVQIQFSQSESGKISNKNVFTTFAVEPYLSRSPAYEICAMIVMLYFVLKLARRVITKLFEDRDHDGCLGVTEFSRNLYEMIDADLIIDVGQIGLFFLIVRQWIVLLNHEQVQNLSLPVLPQEEVTLADFAVEYSTYKLNNAFFILASLWRLLFYFGKFDEAGFIVNCTMRALNLLFMWVCVALGCFLFFAVMAMMMFGSQLEEMSTLQLAFLEMMKISIFDDASVTYSQLQSIDSVSSFFFAFFFTLITTLLLVNIFLAILMDSYTAMQEENRERDDKLFTLRKQLVAHIQSMSRLITDLLTEFQDEARRLHQKHVKGTLSAEDVVHAKSVHLAAVDLGCIMLAGKGAEAQRLLMKRWDTNGDGNLSMEEIVSGISGVTQMMKELQSDLENFRIDDQNIFAEMMVENAIWVCKKLELKKTKERLQRNFLGSYRAAELIKRLIARKRWKDAKDRINKSTRALMGFNRKNVKSLSLTDTAKRQATLKNVKAEVHELTTEVVNVTAQAAQTVNAVAQDLAADVKDNTAAIAQAVAETGQDVAKGLSVAAAKLTGKEPARKRKKHKRKLLRGRTVVNPFKQLDKKVDEHNTRRQQKRQTYEEEMALEMGWDEIVSLLGYQMATLLIVRYGTLLTPKGDSDDPDLHTDEQPATKGEVRALGAQMESLENKLDAVLTALAQNKA